MYPEFYKRISAPLRDSPTAIKVLRILDRVMVAVVAAAYLMALIWLALPSSGGTAWQQVGTMGNTVVLLPDDRFWRVLLVPAFSFILLSIIRAVIDEPRPYETYDIQPLLARKGKGKSFPGRHVFSAAVIACALLWLDVDWGIDGFAAMAVIACLRVIGGVHYPRDVVAGALLGILCGVIGFWII